MKGADAILRIAIGILMKPKTRVEMEAYYDQMKGKLDPKIDAEVGDSMPKAQQDPEPSAAQNQGSNIQGK